MNNHYSKTKIAISDLDELAQRFGCNIVCYDSAAEVVKECKLNDSWLTVSILARKGHMTPLLLKSKLKELYGDDFPKKLVR